MTPATTKREIPETDKGLIFFQSMNRQLEYFYGRWQDEQEYEDFADYVAEVKKLCDAAEGVTFKRMTRAPFRLTFTCDGGYYTATVNSKKMWINRTSVAP